MRRLVRPLADWASAFIAPAVRDREPPPLPRSSPPLPPTPLHTSLASTVRIWYEPIDGTATALVRPYLTAYEREEKARVQRLRRDSLRLATYDGGLDTAVSTEMVYLLNCNTFGKCVAPADSAASPQAPYTTSVDMTPETRDIHACLGAAS
ncbi:hypothetical protein [Streptomyces acidicola]|uniref:hypothetical protein n=1 Tax=Streptomyces acidicola TaxID=2596892 RepID=UPI00341C9DBF